MHLLKCQQGHVYDEDKFRSCPHCSRVDMDIIVGDTFGMNQTDVDTKIPKEANLDEYSRIGMRKVVGMLICTEGHMQGSGFLLKEGENDIGRASNMDVALIRETTISRKIHAVISYGEDKKYVLHPGEDNAEVFCNGRPVKKKRALKDRDVIQLGDCRLVLIEAGDIWQ